MCLVRAAEPGKALRVYEDMMGSALGMLGGPDASSAARSADEQPRKLTRADFEPPKLRSQGSARGGASCDVQNHSAGSKSAAREPAPSSLTGTQLPTQQAQHQTEYELVGPQQPLALKQATQLGPVTLNAAHSDLGRSLECQGPAEPQAEAQVHNSASQTRLQDVAANAAAAAEQRADGPPAGTAGAASTPATTGSIGDGQAQLAEPHLALHESPAVSGIDIRTAGSGGDQHTNAARLQAKPFRSALTPVAGHAVDAAAASTARSGALSTGSVPSSASGSGHSTSLSKRATIPRAAAVGALLHGFAASGDLDKALQLYQQMKRDARGTAQLTLTARPTWAALIELCCRKGRTELALQVSCACASRKMQCLLGVTERMPVPLSTEHWCMHKIFFSWG